MSESRTPRTDAALRDLHLIHEAVLMLESSNRVEQIKRLMQDLSDAQARIADLEAQLRPEAESDRVCHEPDGCPTETAVLQREWRSNRERIAELEADRERLQPELIEYAAELRKDAERLDYLQDLTDENGECWMQHVRTHDGFPVYQICTSYDESEPDRYVDIRAAIDALAAKEKS